MMNIKNIYRSYTPDEILQIFLEMYRISSFIDCEVDEGLEFTKDTTIYEYRKSCDLLPWHKLYKIENEIFRMNVPWTVWKELANQEDEKTLWDLCMLVSEHAKKVVIKPVTIFGKESLEAGVFLTLKRNLKERGIDVESIRPSTSLQHWGCSHFPYLMAEVALTGTKPFESIKVKLRNDISFWRKVNIFSSNKYCIETGSIKTFRDLTKQMAKELA